MEPVIKVEHLSKRYRIGGLHPGYLTLREMIGEVVQAPFKRLRSVAIRAKYETVWALKDFNLEVQQGEIVGLVGQNGAGKSTLLKILSRITEPTEGRITLKGRIGSLLEVGTGFHPDLTGRENVYLSGAVLGMKRAEIAQRFDEIVAFSEIEKFIDTAAKYYSSGMYLRLAFAVAAHLDTEILMMDEVLAVGDASFQQKCLNKMNEIRQQGRTILFVSHNMAAVTRLCKRAVLLHKGRIQSDGTAHKVIHDYLSSSRNTCAQREWQDARAAPGDEIVRLRCVRVHTEEGETTAVIDIRHPVGIEMTYEVLQAGHVLLPNLDLFNEEGVHLFAAHDVGAEWHHKPRSVGRYITTAWIPGNLLSEGDLTADVAIVSHLPTTVLHARERHAVAFQIIATHNGDAAHGGYLSIVPGVIRPLLKWSTNFSADTRTSHYDE